MNALEIAVEVRLDRRIQSEHTIDLVRPHDPVRADVPPPAAHVADALRLGQHRLTAGECRARLLGAAHQNDCTHGDGEAHGKDRRAARNRQRQGIEIHWPAGPSRTPGQFTRRAFEVP
jgi:hypothetical protein